jgi:hypothetical protein
MALKLANLAISSLAASITSEATTLTIQSSDAGKFPALAQGDWHPATILDAAGNTEVVRVTSRNNATLTVVRAQDGSTAKPFVAGSRLDIRMTAGALGELINLISDAYSALSSKADTVTITEFVEQKIASLVDSSPAALDTLKELAAALGNDPNFATTMLNALAGKVSKTGGDTMKAPLALDGNAGAEKMLHLTTGGKLRWKMGAAFDLEAGENVGSDLGFFRFSDDGSYIDGPFRIARNTGVTTINDIRLGNKASAAQIQAGVADKFPDAAAVKAAIAAGSFGVNQIWQDVVANRQAGTVYQNTTGRAITVAPAGWARYSFCEGQISANMNTWFTPPRPEKIVNSDTTYYYAYPMFLVPPGHYYRLTQGNAFLGLTSWWEQI